MRNYYYNYYYCYHQIVFVCVFVCLTGATKKPSNDVFGDGVAHDLDGK